MNQLQSKDVNFNPHTVVSDHSNGTAPVTYMHLLENEAFSMGLFVLKTGTSVLPLHDHPGMHGIIKVVCGTANLESYTEVYDIPIPDIISTNVKRWQKHQIKCANVVKQTVSFDGNCCILTPDQGNIHKISSVTSPVAFIDILAPPYDHVTGKRVCKYYKIIDQSQEDGDTNVDNVKWLMQIPPPNSYWCDSVKYTGPSIYI